MAEGVEGLFPEKDVHAAAHPAGQSGPLFRRGGQQHHRVKGPAGVPHIGKAQPLPGKIRFLSGQHRIREPLAQSRRQAPQKRVGAGELPQGAAGGVHPQAVTARLQPEGGGALQKAAHRGTVPIEIQPAPFAGAAFKQRRSVKI